ncbi:copper resistance system multicopper oxidase [Phenylobacterium sp.]|uniref:copper resistance system multicopper oxidase n=1 Tax=Phenylobacterium sp. TaxID=1871053 RepID=UPI002604BE3D|nr:copper resistance system multicopper oxidase [Phenylobacterium sp.]
MIQTDRRRLLAGSLAFGAAAATQGLLPAWAQGGASPGAPAALSGDHIALRIGHTPFSLGGETGHAVTVNGTLPAPLIRLREGQRAHLSVTNDLAEDTSIHWHGLLLPFQMDGVPGISFPGIRPGETFHYEFPVIQAGTYWYHSHSNLQEAMGCYGPLVIDPAGAEPAAYDREHVIVLSDWSFLHPHEILARLKKSPGYFNRSRTTLSGLLSGEDGMDLAERRMWGAMRMDPRDIADVNGTTYTYLINGQGPQAPWRGLFSPGEKVRLRLINASAMSIFNVRIPGLALRVVQADGADVRPVETDELQISVAETYDVIVEPKAEQAYALVAESVDRSGMAVAMLAPRPGMGAEVPRLREVPTLTMRDMGMGGMAGMDHGAMDHGAMDHAAMGHGPPAAPAAMDHGAHQMRDKALAPPGMAVGVGVDMIAPAPVSRLDERPMGLEDVPHRVLTYAQLVALSPGKDRRAPSRSLEIHLTGNMERFMWGFDGRKFSELVEPIAFSRDERVRVTLVNDTMMAHPIHLHGHFFELVNGAPDGHQPLKHTVNVAPGSKVTFDLTADAPGDWAFHCHMLMHMHAGMFNVVTVRPLDGGAA